jgi:hypothetical protein
MKVHSILLFALFVSGQSFSQKTDSIKTKSQALLAKLENLIRTDGSFKDAVFLCEQGFENRVSAHNYYYDYIKDYSTLLNKYTNTLKADNYKQADRANYILNLSLFTVFCKSITVKSNGKILNTAPFKYNFNDPKGEKDFSSTFVTRLLATHYGNCRSLTYLYKILADELGAKCWLSLAPNHIYIRNYCKQLGWYNTELTSATFPTDAWIAASGYVSPEAIRSGVYLDTLSNQQAIGLCILDLAEGYIRQTKNYTDGFVLKACNVVLQYHSVNPMALLLRSEALKQRYLIQKKKKSAQAQSTFLETEAAYKKLVELGYREMPYKMYQQWLKTATNQ